MNTILLETEKKDISKEINKIFDNIYIKPILEKAVKENCSVSQYKIGKFYTKKKIMIN